MHNWFISHMKRSNVVVSLHQRCCYLNIYTIRTTVSAITVNSNCPGVLAKQIVALSLGNLQFLIVNNVS